LRAHHLTKEDLIGTSDPYVRILKHDDSDKGRWAVAYESKHIADTTDPDFPEIVIKKDKLVSSFKDDEILIQVLDYDVGREPDLIGEIRTTLHDLAGKGTFALYHPDKKGQKVGVLEVENLEVA
jgi:Ca2+-dependent lipid-binding protein